MSVAVTARRKTRRLNHPIGRLRTQRQVVRHLDELRTISNLKMAHAGIDMGPNEAQNQRDIQSGMAFALQAILVGLAALLDEGESFVDAE